MLNLLDINNDYTNEVSTKSIFSYLTSQNVKASKVFPITDYKKTSIHKNKYNLADRCEDGVMFHAWNWYFNDIKNNIKDIAKAGFTSVQVSPIQPTKDTNLSYIGDWWKFYQPTDFSIGNVLGSASDFKDMCHEAKKYGVKIVVDIVANHLANNTGKGNHSKWDRGNNIPSYLKDNDSFWHDECKGAFNNNDKDRTSMTQGAIGMPGLNTANKELQNIIINFLNKTQELGADGFRFDAAKHIELPTDKVSSDFWPTVTAGIKKKNPNSFIYGEILNECATDIKNYSKYIKVTDNEYGWNIIDAVINGNAGVAQNFVKKDSPNNFVTWVESHDTYAGDYGRKSDKVSEEDILLGWCIIASRACSVPLFFGRPGSGFHGNIGSYNPSWKDERVEAINKFHNHFASEGEYIRILNHNNIFLIERGNSGVSIINVGNHHEYIKTETTLKDGTYEDNINNQLIIVENGILTCEVSKKSIVIAYNDKIASNVTTFNTLNLSHKSIRDIVGAESLPSQYLPKVGHLYVTKPSNWGNNVYAYVYSKDSLHPWPGSEMKLQGDGNKYVFELPREWRNDNTQIIFNDGFNQMPMYFNPGEYYKTGTYMIFDGSTIIHKDPNDLEETLRNTYFNTLNKNLNNII